MSRILVVGATSAIAEAASRIWAARGDRLYLLGRNEERLRAMAADLKVRGALSAQYACLDADDFSQHPKLLDDSVTALEGIDTVLIAHGSLGDQKACERDFAAALKELSVNALSVISLLTHLANRLESQKRGTIVVLSSVAGDRGRQSNYVYGTAKGAVNIFVQGLRNRLHRSNVNVLTIKPGFVDTPMTAHLKKGLLWAQPETVARCIVRAVEQRRDVVYTPWFWGGIMLLIRCIPEGIFKALKL